MIISANCCPKTKEALPVSYSGFSAPPVVLVTPYWKGAGKSVGSVSTVDSTTVSQTQIISSNKAKTNYYANVVAFESGLLGSGSSQAISQTTAKTGTSLPINFNPPFTSNDPCVFLTANWVSQNKAVGNVETLDDCAASEIKVISDNLASSNYYVNNVTINPGTYKVQNEGVPTTMIVNRANKTSSGTLRVYFGQIFTAPPIVILSPWWNDANKQVGNIDTLDSVTTEYFDVISGNAADSYFVNWMAIGDLA